MNAVAETIEVGAERVELGAGVLAARFERRRVEGKRDRFYSVRLEPDRQLTLTGEPGFVVLVIRGALDGSIHTRRESFRTFARAAERWGQLCARRRSHKYAEQLGA